MPKPTILGGETPFFAASDTPFVYPPNFGHEPLSVAIDGIDQTRVVACVMLASIQRRAREEYTDPTRLREFMQGALAGANTDLRATGHGPLISYAEVDTYETELAKRGAFTPEPRAR
jgi:hypothetical protein